MKNPLFYTVDAFTSKPFSGNPASVILLDDFPAESTCLQIAKELNQSEVAFVKKLSENNYHIRWFTPLYEVSLCGHATLASAHVLFEQGLIGGKTIHFASKSGDLVVMKNAAGYQLDFPVQKVEETLSINQFSNLNLSTVAAVRAMDVCILELHDEQAVRSYQPDYSRLLKLGYRGVIITAQAQKPYDIISRFFVPASPIPEDPVTGSAHCKLMDYWPAKLGRDHLLAYQASARGGELELRRVDDRVLITGQAVGVLTGELLSLAFEHLQ